MFLAVTCDLDGTLLDTAPDLAAACDAMMCELGLTPHGLTQVRRFVGKGMLSLVERCLTTETGPPSPALLAEGVAIFRRQYQLCNGRSANLYPGVREGLALMREQGLRLAVVTNKPFLFTEPLLIQTGLADFFSATVAGDTTPHKKPHPAPILHACAQLGVEPMATVHIGDSSNDFLAARAAGCLAFAVPYGYNGGNRVDSADCDALVSSLVEAAQGLAVMNAGR